MRYRAKPTVVDAHRIKKISTRSTVCRLTLENGESVAATDEMTARMTPVPGDYWVIQPDGYTYLNPKAVFESKYAPIEDCE